MSWVHDEYRKELERLAAEQAYWLEDVLAGLLVAGCSESDIEVRRFQDDPLRIVVAVRGVPKYEHKISLIG